MQTTLLGLAIAFILALLAAIVGPYVIDWSQFRPEFEREASRVIGLPVRVDGAIDARLLPTPSLSLRGVAIGSRGDANNVSVEKLDVEFSLGELMRGEWRANELSLNGLILELALDEKGGFNWGARPGGFNLGALTVDKFHVTGAASLSDMANQRSLQLDDIAFTGEVRALAGSIRGEGALKVDGLRTPFRLATGRTADGNGQRVRLSIEPGARTLAADLDGVLQFDRAVPRFDGSLSVSRPVPAKGAAAAMPWRLGGKLKADPASARLDQLEVVLGPDDTGLKFSGEAEARFGASPRARAALHARQLDADRFLAQGSAAAPSPAQMLSSLRGLIASAPAMPIATELAVDAEIVNLGARPVQNAAIELRADATEWTVDRLEFRAPGASRVALTGRVTEPGDSGTFAGALNLEAGDPEGFALWLQGHGDNAYRVQKPLKARGDVVVSSRQVTVDGFKAEIDGRQVEGRFSLGADGGKSRLEASLKAEKLDFDAASAFARAFGGTLKAWPDEGDVSLEIAQLGVGGQALKPVLGRLTYDAKLISLQRLRIGDADGVAIDGNGSFDRAAATGQMNFSATSATLDPLARLVEPIAPAFGRRIAAIPAGAGNIWVGLSLDLEKPQGDVAGVKAVLDIHAPQLKGSLTATMTPRLAALQALDSDALMKTEATIAAKIGAERSDALLALLGLDGVLAAGEGPAQLEASATGVWNAPLKLKASLRGPGFDAGLDGSAELFKGERSGTVALRIGKADLAPLLGITEAARAPVALSLSSQAKIAGARIDFETIDGALAGARLRGRLAMTFGDELGLDGNLDADALDIPSAMLAAIGAIGHDSAEPLNRGLLSGWRGRVAFSSARAKLPGGELRPFSGVVKHDGQALVFESLTGGIGGGKIEAGLVARKLADGVHLTGRIQASGVDGASLKVRGLAMPAGRVSAQVTLSGQGRSAASLIGSLGGNGAVSIAQARISGLDPRAFEAAIRASDVGVARDDAKLAAAVGPVLAGGALVVPSAEIPFTIRDGQLRVSNTTLMGEGARLNLSGGYDIAADQMDVRAALSAAGTDTANIGRPEILVLLFGSPDKPDRSLDVAALSSWLGLRAIDRETKRLDAIEKTNPLLNPSRAPDAAPQERPPVRPSPPPPANVPPPAAPRAEAPSATAPPLPPPVEVKPAPGASRPPQRQNGPLVIAPRF